MVTNPTDFKLRFPEFASIDDARIQLFLDDAVLMMTSEDKWLEYYTLAQSYYAAHLLIAGEFSSMGDSGAMFPLAHSEVDDVVLKRAVGDVDPKAEELLSTTYGKRYLKYRKICLTGVRTTTVGTVPVRGFSYIR